MRRICLGFLLILLEMTPAASAQIRLSPGIYLGTPVTDSLASTSSSSSTGATSTYNRFNSVTKRLLIGPSLRLELPHGLGLEFDALYQRINFDYAYGSNTPGAYADQTFEQTTANRWQFPLLVQYSRSVAKVKPFVEAGPSISTITGWHTTGATSSVNILSPVSISTYSRTSPAITTAGITAGGGIEIPFLGHSLRAAVRFSHWFGNVAGSPVLLTGQVYFNTAGYVPPRLWYAGSTGFQTQPNEASFLLGFSF